MWSRKTLLGLGLLTLLGALVAPSTVTARDYDCADFSSQGEAQEYLLPGDPYRLDADNDGIACEDLPPGGGEGTTTEPPPEPAPPPYRLSKPAARSLAKSMVRSFVNGSPRLDSMAFQGCSRLGERRVDCKLIARGRTATDRTGCHFTVSVGARNRHPVGHFAVHRCRTVGV
jgi:hypothetical protein